MAAFDRLPRWMRLLIHDYGARAVQLALQACTDREGVTAWLAAYRARRQRELLTISVGGDV